MLESTSWHSGNSFAISKGPTIASSRFLFTFSDQCSSWLPVSTDSPASRTRTAANCDLQLRPDTGSELYVGLRTVLGGPLCSSHRIWNIRARIARAPLPHAQGSLSLF